MTLRFGWGLLCFAGMIYAAAVGEAVPAAALGFSSGGSISLGLIAWERRERAQL